MQNPSRAVLRSRGASLAPTIEEGVKTFTDGDVVREIRVGTHPGGVTRVVLDTRGVARHSLFTLYNPYRLVLDMYREPGALTQKGPPSAPTAVASGPHAGTRRAPAEEHDADAPAPAASANAPRRRGEPTRRCRPRLPARMSRRRRRRPNPTAPATIHSRDSWGSASRASSSTPATAATTWARSATASAKPNSCSTSPCALEKLLKQEAGIDVVMTRRTDEFIELEERTRIANRQNADMFLSIHANSSRKKTAQGVETFVLNFANTSDAEEVAARENAIAKGSMRQLPDIVKAITLNNKLDESRDLAEIVQGNLVSRLRKTESELPDRGIKQAPLVVLIGASMPSVLAEIGFVSTPEEGGRLKTAKYRQEIAEALRDAVHPLPAIAQGQHDGLRTRASRDADWSVDDERPGLAARRYVMPAAIRSPSHLSVSEMCCSASFSGPPHPRRCFTSTSTPPSTAPSRTEPSDGDERRCRWSPSGRRPRPWPG